MQRRDVAGHDGLASHFVEGDLLGAVARGGGDRDGADHGIGVSGSPLQRLHPAHRSAGDGEQALDAEGIDQHLLQAHHVAWRSRETTWCTGSRWRG
jgi:hypothetical protein